MWLYQNVGGAGDCRGGDGNGVNFGLDVDVAAAMGFSTECGVGGNNGTIVLQVVIAVVVVEMGCAYEASPMI
ncbi:Hypothetical predicted protein [Olea europaea subsp. europaea]|uniref:Uncharacterized protein n=1 Tax=Olea europaea subsp. europaea TaxID=158383 RepID=A0A8S0UTH7_OLEEU|nr:Hypothetical predicted protein [Olea europaea subsp. europaea]